MDNINLCYLAYIAQKSKASSQCIQHNLVTSFTIKYI